MTYDPVWAHLGLLLIALSACGLVLVIGWLIQDWLVDRMRMPTDEQVERDLRRRGVLPPDSDSPS